MNNEIPKGLQWDDRRHSWIGYVSQCQTAFGDFHIRKDYEKNVFSCQFYDMSDFEPKLKWESTKLHSTLEAAKSDAQNWYNHTVKKLLEFVTE